MYKKSPTVILFCFLTLVLLLGCNVKPGKVPDAENSVYYWRTVFRLDSTEQQFLAHNHVKKIYMRYFDVVWRDGQGARPNATIKFAQAVPQNVEVVPTVFIVENVMRGKVDSLAQRIVKRVLQMCETHHIAGVKELQIDYDWTASTQQPYFNFMKQVKAELEARGMRLSTTIRLHQLPLDVPPAHYGVLMMYNTGNVTNAHKRNPILDYRDAKPYFKYLRSYRLPLCVAYPIFEWRMLFSGTDFKGILHEANLSNKQVFKPVSPNCYVVTSSYMMPSQTGDVMRVNVGDSVVVHRVPAPLIHAIANEIETLRHGINEQVIIYDLESKYIKNYEDVDFKKMYRR